MDNRQISMFTYLALTQMYFLCHQLILEAQGNGAATEQ